MRDINQPIRTAFYQLLNGNLTYESTVIPVCDEQLKKDLTNNYYVILSSQSSRPDDTKSSLDREASITLDIVTKTNNSVSKDICDNIANQIFSLVFPSSTRPHLHNLPTQSGLQFLKVSVSNDRYLSLQLDSTQHIIRRILEFSLRVVY